MYLPEKLITQVIARTAQMEGYTYDQVTLEKRNRPLPDIRAAIMFNIKKYSLLSLKQIGKYFNNRDHSTVKHDNENIKYNYDLNNRPVIEPLHELSKKIEKIVRDVIWESEHDEFIGCP